MHLSPLRRCGALLLSAGAVAAVLVAPGVTAVPAMAAVSCGDLSAPVLQRAKPGGTALLTLWPQEAAGAADRHGFTQNLGSTFRAAGSAGPGLVPVRRFYHPGTGDFLFTTDPEEGLRAGYLDQGERFYASATPTSCLVGIERFVRNGRYRWTTQGQGGSLARDGWRSQGVRFYARPAGAAAGPQVLSTRPIPTTTGSTFSFAVIPDTQLEVLRAGDPRLANRSAWLLRQPKMSFALQTGDLVNWDTDDHVQYRRAERGLAPLDRARLPYTVAIGNHDTLATGPGGSARDPRRSSQLIRETATLNSFFPVRDVRGAGGVFEAGKMDNLYTLYRAGGLKWMVLTLEFCPRRAAVDWARRVVAAHPDYNVIISTHYYLTRSGRIDTRAAGYGESSPRELWDRLVGRYPNIKFVYSGHTGKARRARSDRGVHGNTVHSFLTTMHDGRTNPTRIVTVDTRRGTLRTQVHAPYTRTTWNEYSETIVGLRLVR